jgi:hypothetical protein
MGKLVEQGDLIIYRLLSVFLLTIDTNLEGSYLSLLVLSKLKAIHLG